MGRALRQKKSFQFVLLNLSKLDKVKKIVIKLYEQAETYTQYMYPYMWTPMPSQKFLSSNDDGEYELEKSIDSGACSQGLDVVRRTRIYEDDLKL
ncbi:hypothetical protein NPIL_334901 [Nephila pilipes]|uniref:Uncharacterized protein n=1 Tax=Nephila pilipes TaxID=299642 RepID=A0A8X6NHS1_NEPPI|nr:hypothetical protein NPIL_334901 [Nephila pilipes]